MKKNILKPFYLLGIVAAGSCSSPRQTADEPKTTVAPTTIDLLVGTYTGSGSNGIYQLQFNPQTGELSDSVLLVATTNPSYLTISRDRALVMAVNETREGGVSSFSWNHAQNTLTEVTKLSSEGAHPCYIDFNNDESLLAVANYSSGNLSVYTMGEGGVIQPGPQVRQHTGSGPVAPNQQGPHAHCSIFRDGYLYAVDLGIDQVLAYPVNSDGTLAEPRVALQLEAGDGPRHLIFHPTSDLAFVVNELSSSVVSAKADFEGGVFEAIDKVSTLPEGFAEKNADADIHISPDGKFLYASNRGHNSLAIMQVAADGTLSALGHEPVRGNWPRNFALSPDGRFVLVANQESNNITVFERNADTGLLTFTGHEYALSKPVCLKF